MSGDERPLFDDEIIQMHYRGVPNMLHESSRFFNSRLNSTTDISSNQFKMLLDLLGNTMFRFLPLLYQTSAFNMALLNDMDKVINHLPEDFHEIRSQYQNLVKLTKEQYDYVKWATKLHEELAKDIDKNE
jgi:RNA processing factor Prp31